ncbi:hypothetical protein CMK11_20645 [Candidatus Poribacteria bacterium]|nr:hypothetical protein [Candidatus Poribacteria bacterium]
MFPVGIVLIALNSWWVMLGSEVWHSTQLTIASMFWNAVFTLFLVVIGGGILRRVAPRVAPTRAEILVLYAMVVIISTISGHTMMGYLLPAIEHAYWFATPENEWPQLFGHHLPDWLVVKDREALRGYFEGDASLYDPVALRAWLPPVLAWSGVIVVLWTALMLTATLLRRQWTEHEKLSYPVTQLPLALTADPVRFFRSRWMWVGFGIVMALDIWNGVAFLRPAVPSLAIKNHRVATFTTRPWNAIGGVSVSFYPFVIGLMYFTPLDLSFSCWFFYVFGRLSQVLVVVLGGQNGYSYEQSIGAWVALGLIPIWLGRRWFMEMARYIVRGRRGGDRIDADEPVGYRSALLGIVASVAILGFVWISAGMSWWVFALYFAIYFPMVIGIARSRAEIGPPVHTLIYVDPGRTLVAGMGTQPFGPRNLSLITLLYPLNRCYRANPMPSQLEALRIAERAGVRPRAMVIGMTVATVVGSFLTFWIYLHVLYDMGADNRARGWIVHMGFETYNRLQSWLVNPRDPRPLEVAGMYGGFGFTMLLMFLKSRFLWFPFHPGGYVLTTGGGFGREWFATFVSWALKLVILRMGGIKAYRAAAPFFLGVLLGDYTMGCLWSLIGLIWDMPTYGVWH